MPRGRPVSCKAPFKDGETERKCQLDAGHQGRHGLRPRIVIPQDQFVLEDVEDDERGKVRRKRTERDEQQVIVDTLVLTQWKLWTEHGNGAETWAKVPLDKGVVRRWKVDRRFEEQAVRMLHNAANHEGKKVIIGDIDQETIPGKSRIPFFVITRPEKDSETPATAVPESGPSPDPVIAPAGQK